MVSDGYPCVSYPTSPFVDAVRRRFRSNRIATYGAVSFMSLCPAILELDLRGNPVHELADYRDTVHDMMPDLKLLDSQPFYDRPPPTDESLSSSDYSSSTATSTSEQLDAKRCTSAEFELLTGASGRVFDPSKLRHGAGRPGSTGTH